MKSKVWNEKWIIAAYVTVFGIMVVANFLTPYLCDDYNYMYSFETGEKISSFSDIVVSLVAHWKIFNGRIPPHFLAHIFCSFQKFVFNIFNSVAFVAEIALLVFYSGIKDKRRVPFVIILFFCIIWCFQPSFGQVNLWMSGSLNYLWCSVFLLLWFIPFYELLIGGKAFNNIIFQIFYVLYSLLCGGYSENASPTVICMGSVILLIMVIRKRKIQPYLVVSILSAICGFVLMISSPAVHSDEFVRKFSISDLLFGVWMCVSKMADFTFLIAIIIVVAVLTLISKRYEHLPENIVFIFGGLAASFSLMFSVNYPLRRTSFSFILLTLVAVKMGYEYIVTVKNFKMIFAAVLLVSVSACAVQLKSGFSDIIETRNLAADNEQKIIQAVENGDSSVTLPGILPETRYSAAYDTVYIAGADQRPNINMEKYYGIEKIYPEEE